MKLHEVAERLGGRLENVTEDLEITGIGGIEEASAGQITFVANPKYAAAARITHAAVIIVPRAEARSRCPQDGGCSSLRQAWQGSFDRGIRRRGP